MPPPSVWGPPLWKVLHGLGSTTAIHASLQQDSERESLWLLTHLEYILPCKECTEHLLTFKRKYPVPRAHVALGEWICRLHNSVNEKLSKEIVPYTQRPPTDVKGDWGAYLDSIKDSIQLGLVAGDKLREFVRHMGLWIRYSS